MHDNRVALFTKRDPIYKKDEAFGDRKVLRIMQMTKGSMAEAHKRTKYRRMAMTRSGKSSGEGIYILHTWQ